MGLYSKYVLPTLTDLAMRSHTLRPERARWVPLAKGVVLEIGVGSGLNLPMYGREVRKLYALDPSEGLLRMARLRGGARSVPGGISVPAGRGHPARGGVGGLRCHNLDPLHDPGSGGGSPGDASGAAARGSADLRRAWALARSGSRPMAGPAHAALAEGGGRLPPEPADRPAPAIGRVRGLGDEPGLPRGAPGGRVPLSGHGPTRHWPGGLSSFGLTAQREMVLDRGCVKRPPPRSWPAPQLENSRPLRGGCGLTFPTHSGRIAAERGFWIPPVWVT